MKGGLTIKTCKKCFREFNEEDIPDFNPAAGLADIFLEEIGVEDINDICPECRKKLDIMNLLWFGE